MSFDLVVRTVEKEGSHSGSINGWVLWDCEGVTVLIAKVAVFILLYHKSTRKQISTSFTVHCKFWLHITQVELNTPVRQIGVDTLWKDSVGGLAVCVNHVCSKGIAFGGLSFADLTFPF